MPVIYSNKAIIPAPLISIRYEERRGGDGLVHDGVFRITLTGKLLAQRGSPGLDGSWYSGSGYPPDPLPTDPLLAPDARLRVFNAKLGALTSLLKTPGKKLEIQSYDGGGQPFYCFPRFVDLTYSEGIWFEHVDYQATFDADEVWFGGSKVSAWDGGATPEQSWSLEPSDDTGRLYKFSHSVTAVGRRQYNDDGSVAGEGWEVARDRILGGPLAPPGTTSVLGPKSSVINTVLVELNGRTPHNRVRSSQIDEAGGRVTITETWIVVDGTQSLIGVSEGLAYEELSSDTRYDTQSGLYTVTLEGSVQGLAEYDGGGNETTSRWANAEARFTPFYSSTTAPAALAASHTGLTLNPLPLSSTVARNKNTGLIRYSVVFDTRPANTAGYLYENYSITIEDESDVIARIGVVGRGSGGTIKQDVDATTDSTATVSAEIHVPVSYAGGVGVAPTWNPLPLLIAALGRTPTVLYLLKPTRNFEPRTGRYTASYTYLYE